MRKRLTRTHHSNSHPCSPVPPSSSFSAIVAIRAGPLPTYPSEQKNQFDAFSKKKNYRSVFKKNPLFRSFADFSELSNDFSMAHFTFPHDDPLFLNGDRTRAQKKREKEREKLFFGGQGKRGAEKPIQALRPNGPTDRLEASRDPFLFSSTQWNCTTTAAKNHSQVHERTNQGGISTNGT